MKILIKSNPKESESIYRFYVTKNNQVVQAHLTLDQATALRDRIKATAKGRL
jgi:hypothetical protein